MNETITMRTTTSLFALFCLVTLPLMASAQERSLIGTWEGYSSRGNFVIIAISEGEEGALVANTTVIDGGLGGTPATEDYTLGIEHTSDYQTTFDVGGELGTLEAYWYNDDAMRLHLSSDILVVMARVATSPDASAVVVYEAQQAARAAAEAAEAAEEQ